MEKKKLITILIAILLVTTVFATIGMIKLVSAAGECSGYPDACSSHNRDQQQCGICGCDWVYVDPIWECWGTPTACSSHGASGVCTDCGCDWTEEILFYINVGDAWKDVTAVYINVGDVWKTVTGIYINIGDAWKTAY